MTLPKSETELDILVLHVLSTHDPGFGLNTAEITRAIHNIPEDEQRRIIAQHQRKPLDK